MRKIIVIPIIFLLVIASILAISTKYILVDENLINLKVKNCSRLNYEDSLLLHPKKFSSLNLEIKFNSIREWRKNNILSLVQAEKNKKESGYFKRFFTDRKRVNGKIIFNLEDQIKCFVKAKIRAHGDLEDHFNIELPSLDVHLTDGHIFGITKFKLYIPRSRSYDNELIVANLFKEIGLMSPRTSTANVKFYNKNIKFIFQESISKEFLEHNNKREFPIFSGDERFTFFDALKVKQDNFSNYKLDNKNFIKDSQATEIIAKYGLSLLNKINFYSEGEFYPESVDLSYISNNLFKKDFFENYQIFSSIMIAVNSIHNISRDDGRIYFNKEYDKFIPIYYDGSPKLGSKNDFLDNDCFNYQKKINCKFTKSSVDGANEAIKLIDNLNIQKFKKNLLKYNFDIDELDLGEGAFGYKKTKNIRISNIDNLIKKIKRNLINLSKTNLEKTNRVVKIAVQKDPFKNALINNKKITNPELRKLVYHSNNFESFLICDIQNINCKIKNFEKEDLKKLISQNLKVKKNNNNINLNFTSRTNQKIDSVWYHEFYKKKFSGKKKVEIDKNLSFNIIGNIDYKVFKVDKLLLLNKYDNYSKIIFENQNLKDWEIRFYDNSKNDYNNLKFVGLGPRGYTGCLNFFDSYITDIKIKFFNSRCEDAVNFVRSKGTVKEVEIYDSLFDSLDADFSDLKFSNIKIKKSDNDCLDFSFGNYIIEYSNLTFCGDKAISVGELSKVLIKNTNIKFSNDGIVSKDFAEVKVFDSSIKNTKYCFRAYNKKQEFSGGHLEINNTLCDDTNTFKLENDNRSEIDILK